MGWSIAEVARMAKVTSRTLRHYHAIGLLEPAWVGANGYRYYEREQLLRLQHILLLRELDLDLPTIAEILAGQQDARTTLRLHREHLRRERQRLSRLERTVTRTLAQIEGGELMNAENYFDGFDQKRQEAYERELIDRYGDATRARIAESHEKTTGWTQADYDRSLASYRGRLSTLAGLMKQGLSPDAPEVQEIIAGHHEWLTQFWTPDAASFTGLGEMYATAPRFRDEIDTVTTGLADYLRDVMTAYAETSMT